MSLWQKILPIVAVLILGWIGLNLFTPHSPVADTANIARANYTYLEELKDARDTLQRVIDSMEESR